ncbi:IS66 family insertion sequence element accessory protein TnpB [Cereibacter changlensis]|uniref:IS66 family insertion sequence element accessory protein TnpB n=1 Tax=Cereibacter changlensis TaxID=402884 RepID=UPI0040341467
MHNDVVNDVSYVGLVMRGDILGLERRRRWSDDEKLEIVLSVGMGGATVTQVAQRRDVSRQQIYAWRHELKKKVCFRHVRRRCSCRWSWKGPGTGGSADGRHLRSTAAFADRAEAGEWPLPALRPVPGTGHADASYPGGGSGMIGPGTGVRVYLACGVTDMRKGIEGLAALAQDHLRQKPTGGAVFAFRGRRGDRLKLCTGMGKASAFTTRFWRRTLPWPARGDGAARLTSAQLAMLWEGIDWRRPDWGAPPARVG